MPAARSIPEFGPDADIASLDRQTVLEFFEACVAAGIVKYDPEFTTQNHTFSGIDFEFRISKALAAKPHETTSPLAITNPASIPRPGSDLTTTGTEISALGPHHFLAFNGFACYRPHFMMLTKDGFRRQWEFLDEEDWLAAHEFLESEVAAAGPAEDDDDEYLFFFNGGPDAGCSRVHKHMQAIPKHSYGGDIWKNLDSGAVPLVYFEKKFQRGGFSAQASLEAYQEGMRFTAKVLAGVGAPVVQAGDGEGEKHHHHPRAPAHSVLMDRSRMVVVPRVACGTGGVGANAAGMLGMVWVQSEAMLEKWLTVGPDEALRAAGVLRRGGAITCN